MKMTWIRRVRQWRWALVLCACWTQQLLLRVSASSSCGQILIKTIALTAHTVVSETDGQNGDALLVRLRCTQSPLKMRWLTLKMTVSKTSQCYAAKLFEVNFGGIYHCHFPKNPPIALQDGVGLVGTHTLHSYSGVYLKSFKAENATAFDQFESNWSEKLSACRATAA